MIIVFENICKLYSVGYADNDGDVDDDGGDIGDGDDSDSKMNNNDNHNHNHYYDNTYNNDNKSNLMVVELIDKLNNTENSSTL